MHGKQFSTFLRGETSTSSSKAECDSSGSQSLNRTGEMIKGSSTATRKVKSAKLSNVDRHDLPSTLLRIPGATTSQSSQTILGIFPCQQSRRFSVSPNLRAR